MKTTRLARRLGLDGNPMRRHIDKIAAGLAALLVAVFLIGAPILSMALARRAGHAAATGQQATRSAPGARCLAAGCACAARGGRRGRR